jgi:acyl transferase domain-containing protein/acyl-CoA synthetase (AMP-forming)/AMP-acid ligase II/acyl carrier protein/ubiquinone/menaquinone biosynthesis C-methylase UbiE
VKKDDLKFSTLVALLRFRALNQPSRRAFTFLSDGEVEAGHLTYLELDRKARAIAAHLESLGAAGERALLLYPSGLDFIAAFSGCLYAGVVAVPVNPPRPNRKISRLHAILKDAEATLTLTTATLLPNIESQFAELGTVRYLATDKVTGDLAASWQEPAIASNSLAFLQYTSGSTGDPKGVMVSHGNLLHNLEYMKQAFELTADSVSVTWVPNFHDLGLIDGLIQPVYTGFLGILMPPASFVQRPVRWLQAISHYKATHCGGPNFAYDLCVSDTTPEQRESLDLSSWCNAFNGAEPVRRGTLERFASAFKSCGFRSNFLSTCYGMAETTLVITTGIVQDEPIYFMVSADALEQNKVVKVSSDSQDVKHLVGCGRAWLDTEIVIADPESLTRCAPDQVGEIWIRGLSVAQGYWNRPEQTEQTFRAYLADTGEGPFLRTGDLGFLQDNELFVTGRLKDLIIIEGRNHYPQDIELTVEQCHPDLLANGGAAFSVEIDSQERLMIAQEVKRTSLRKLNADEAIRTIRLAVTEEHDIEVYGVALLKTASLPKTSSGKTQRRTCRAQILDGSLDVVADWRVQATLQNEKVAPEQKREESKKQSEITPAHNQTGDLIENQQKSQNVEAIKTWLAARIAQELQCSSKDLDMRQPFAAHGIGSLKAVRISGELEEWLGHPLSPTLFYDYPTIEILAQYLAGEPAIVSAHNDRAETETEAIAVIGMGCRFPGAQDPESFWQLLHNGVDAIQEVPNERWDVDHFYHPEPGHSDKMNTRWGGFLEHVDHFDPQFFEISPREAEGMDPQQRLLLEVSWEALEHAGQAPERLAGSQTGVFVGISNGDYSRLQLGQPSTTDAYSGTGNAFSIAANRLSYLLDLQGPSWSVDTACSSSLVALHQACQSLRQGECQLALAGGVNLILAPQLSITFSQARMLSTGGRCKTFDASADGYVRSEGCGVVVLKRLSDALSDGNNILAVVRGSAVNQDGRSNGLTAPNGPSQQRVIRQALENAGVAPSQIGYVEAHGTGTPLGDPIEVNALQEVLLQERDATEPCWIGSVKANIGHLEAAAGIAGFIKAVLSLQQEEIPPHLHLTQLNEQIHLEGTPLLIPRQSEPWLRGEKQRFAGVSSFGFGGTNAHVVLEESPEVPEVTDRIEHPWHLLTLSAKSEAALQSLVHRYDAFLEACPQEQLADVCFTANTGRSHFDHRLAIVAESPLQMRARLRAFADGKQSERRDQANVRKTPKIAFLFTGQGSQYMGMGRQLYDTEPNFRKTLDYCDSILKPYLEHSLLDTLYASAGDETLLDETAYTQPILFAIEYALAQLWKSWGIEPAAVIGHSLGEYVAACVAGVFSLEDGLKLIAERSRLIQALPKNGKMVAVFTDEARVEAAIQPHAQEVSIATVNSSQNVAISGVTEAVEAVVQSLEVHGIETRPLKVSHSFHSSLMEPMLDSFEQLASQIKFQAPSIPMISTLSGRPLPAGYVPDADHWRNHTRRTVRFMSGMENLFEQGYELFLEIGPKSILSKLGQQCNQEETVTWLPSLASSKEDWQVILESLAALYRQGAAINWDEFYQGYQCKQISLPTYPFQRRRYWLDEGRSTMQSKQLSSDPKRSSSVMNILEKIAPFSEHDSQPDIARIEELFKALESYSRACFHQIELPSKIESRFHKLAAALASIPYVAPIERDQFISQYPELIGYVNLLDICLAAYPKILSGAVDPLSVIFPNGSFDLMEPIYRNNLIADYFNKTMSRVIEEFIRLRPGKKTRIIEIGAGTGSTTEFVLPVIKNCDVEYLFTDISLVFLNKAKARFLDYDFVRYEIYNVEQAPTFDQPFDIVIANNVIHATTALNASVGNVRRLLSDNGIFILNELTSRQDFATIAFGLIDGWWLSTDPYRISNSPLMTGEAWREVIEEAGFVHTVHHGTQVQQVIVASTGERMSPSEAVQQPEPVPPVTAFTPAMLETNKINSSGKHNGSSGEKVSVKESVMAQQLQIMAQQLQIMAQIMSQQLEILRDDSLSEESSLASQTKQSQDSQPFEPFKNNQAQTVKGVSSSVSPQSDSLAIKPSPFESSQQRKRSQQQRETPYVASVGSLVDSNRIKVAPSGERQRLLLKYLHDKVAQVLHLELGTSLDGQTGLVQIGMDSLMAIEIKNLILTDLGIDLPTQTFIEKWVSIERLTELLLERLAVMDLTSAKPFEADGKIEEITL